MAGKCIALLLALCVTLAVSYPSEEYSTEPKDTEAELGTLVSMTPSSYEPLEPETTLIEHQLINEDADLIVQTTDTTQSSETNMTSPRSAEVDQTESGATFLEENAETSTTAVNTQDYAENTEVTTHPPTNTIPNETESTNRTTHTIINSQALDLDWTTSQSDGGHQTSTTNTNYERTTHSNEFKSEEIISTTSDDIPTTFEIDTVNSQNISTLETDKFTNITSNFGSSEVPTVSTTPASAVGYTNISSNTSELTTQNPALNPSFAVTFSLDDLPITTEEDELTLTSGGSDQSRIEHTTVIGTDIFEDGNRSTENTEKSATHGRNETTAIIQANDNSSATQSTQVVLTQTVQEEILSRTSFNISSTTESLSLSEHPITQMNVNDSGTLNTSCNNNNPCASNQVCVLKNGGCFCVSNTNTFSDVQICANLTEHSGFKPSNNSSSIIQNVDNTTGALDQAGHQEFVNSFFVKKVRELSGREKSRNVVTVSFSPAMEVVEWFQSYDWRFRKYVSVALTTCMRHTMVNEINHTRIFTPFDIGYLAPSPYQDALTINVSFLVRNPGDDNTTFIHNRIVVACLNEECKHCETEFDLTINSIEAAWPKRLLSGRTVSVAGLSANTVKLLFIGSVISFTLVFLSLLVFTIKCRQARGRFDPRSGLYRHPRVLTRSPGDGHNLATDEQCQQDEGRRKEPENGDTWVVPLEEVEAMEREIKSEKEEDSKV